VRHIISDVDASDIARTTFTFSVASASAGVGHRPKRLIGEVRQSAVTYAVKLGKLGEEAESETYRGPELAAAIAAYNEAP